MNTTQRTSILDVSLRCLTHPLTWLTVALLLINDHLLKVLMPSWLTGKLSDFAGLFFFPFVLAALLSLPLDRLRVAPRRAGAFAIGITGVCFALIKTVPAINLFAGELFSRAIGYRTSFALDPTDLLALIMLLPAWWLWVQPVQISRRRAGWVGLAIGAVACLASQPPMREQGIVQLEMTKDDSRLTCTQEQPFGPDFSVSDIAVAPDGKVWLATSEGAARFDSATSTWQIFTPTVTSKETPPVNLRAVAIEPDGTAWFTPWNVQGLPQPVYRFDGTSLAPFTQIDSVITSTVDSVTVAPDNAIWFSARAGTYRWDRSTNTWTNYAPYGKVYFTSDGTVWLASMGEVDYSAPDSISGKIDHWNTRRGFHGDGYDTAYISTDGRIWFGGQKVYDPQAQRWAETVYRDYANDFAIDKQGRLWLATDRATILVPDPMKSTPDQWQYLGGQNGLVDGQMHSVALEGDNIIWFGGETAFRCTIQGPESHATHISTSVVYDGYESRDGGLTWAKVNRPNSDYQTYWQRLDQADAHVTWTLTDSQNSEIVYRFTPGQGIARSADGGKVWIDEVGLQPFSEAQHKYYQRFTQGDPHVVQGPFESIADPHTGNVIASMGVEGVVVRTPDAPWHWVKIGEYQHVNSTGSELLGTLDILEIWLGAILAGLMLGVGVWAWGCRFRSLNAALIVGFSGMVVAYLAGSARTYIPGGIDGMQLWMLGALSVASLAALAAGYRGLTYPMGYRARSIGIALVSMVLFWLPFILWTQNIIPYWQLAMVIATLGALMMLVFQYSSLRRLARKPVSSLIL
jgi:hypothetical protein